MANIIVINLVLIVCWMPIVVQFFVDIRGELPAFVYHIEMTFIYLNSAINVLIYGVVNQTQRQAYKRLFASCSCSKKPT